METYFGLSRRVRLIVSLAYGAAAGVLIIGMLRASAFTVPLLLIALSIPLIFRLVPRNWIYGLRVPSTMRGSEETWYSQNRIAGLAMALVGVIWLLVVMMR